MLTFDAFVNQAVKFIRIRRFVSPQNKQFPASGNDRRMSLKGIVSQFAKRTLRFAQTASFHFDSKLDQIQTIVKLISVLFALSALSRGNSNRFPGSLCMNRRSQSKQRKVFPPSPCSPRPPVQIPGFSPSPICVLCVLLRQSLEPSTAINEHKAHIDNNLRIFLPSSFFLFTFPKVRQRENK